MSTRSRSTPPNEDELRLPRPPGVIRRFWARHPLLADILVTLVCLAITLGSLAAGAVRDGRDGAAQLSPQVVTAVLTPLGVAACLLLLRRRQWPIVVLVGAHLLAVALLISPSPTSTPLLLVASYSVAVYRSSRIAWLALAVGIGGLGLIAGLLATVGVISLAFASNAVVGELVFALIGTLIGVNVGNRKRYLEAIIDRSRQLLVERDQQALLAAAAERARIARELHDIVSHSLTVIVALAEGATATADVARGKAATVQVADTARGALREMRAMLGVLRDDTAPDLPLSPVDDDLVVTAVAAARNAGFPVTLTTSGAGLSSLPRPVRLAAGRVAQEGLTNAMRHANATAITVGITTTDAEVVVDVRNDGVRGPVADGGFGLRGLHERVEHVGGALEAGPDGSGGWRLRARLPLHGDPAHSHPIDLAEESA